MLNNIKKIVDEKSNGFARVVIGNYPLDTFRYTAWTKNSLYVLRLFAINIYRDPFRGLSVKYTVAFQFVILLWILYTFRNEFVKPF